MSRAPSTPYPYKKRNHTHRSQPKQRFFATTDANRPPLPPPYLPDHSPCAQCGLPRPCFCNQGVADVPHNQYGTVPPCQPPIMQHADAQHAQALWRLPEYAATAARSSREGTIAATVPDLPSCAQLTPRQIIRNQGLYGIKGDWRCDRFQRSTFQDTRFVEPIGARNEFLSYNAYDQLHARDPYMVANARGNPALLHRNPGPFDPAH